MKDSVTNPSEETVPQGRILVVDDDDDIRHLVSRSLQRHGYAVDAAPDTAKAEVILARRPYDLVVLDIMMPGEDGLSFCRRLAGPDGPMILILSALDASSDRIVGLEVGADAYCPKPCEPRELVATVRALMRRARVIVEHGPQVGRCAEFWDWQLDLIGRFLRDPEGHPVELSTAEFLLLRSFVESPRRVLTRDHLLDQAHGAGADIFDRAIDVQVSRVRRKLAPNGRQLIKTVRNEGYMFIAPVIFR